MISDKVLFSADAKVNYVLTGRNNATFISNSTKRTNYDKNTVWSRLLESTQRVKTCTKAANNSVTQFWLENNQPRSPSFTDVCFDEIRSRLRTTLCPKNMSTFLLFNEILRKYHIKSLQICPPVRCSHFILGNPKMSFSTTLIRISDYLRQNKTNCNRDCEVAHHIWKMSPHYLVKCRRYRYIVFLQMLVVLKRNRLSCVATWMWGKQRHNKCSKCPPSAWTHVSSLFRHWSIASSTTLCWNSADVSTNLYVRLRGRPYIRTCRSYVHTPRELDMPGVESPTGTFIVGTLADFGLLGIPCQVRRWTTVQNLTPLA